jgi:alanyl-tRNA synthetase
VTPDKLRFDFSHAKALTPQQVASVEASVAAVVAAALPVFTQVVPLHAARAISGLRAVFGETYPDPVRVVSVRRLSPFRARGASPLLFANPNQLFPHVRRWGTI